MSISVEELDTLPGEIMAGGELPGQAEDDAAALVGLAGDRRLSRGRSSTALSDGEGQRLRSLDAGVRVDLELPSAVRATQSQPPQRLLGGRKESRSVTELSELEDARRDHMRRSSIAMIGAGLGSHVELVDDVEEEDASASADVEGKPQRTRGRLRMDLDKLALRMAAFDHESSQSIKYHSVAPHEVQMMKRRANKILMSIRTEGIDSLALFTDCPPEMADEPVFMLRTRVHNLPWRQRLLMILRTKIQLDALVLVFVAMFALIAAWKKWVIFPHTDYNDPARYDLGLAVTERSVLALLTFMAPALIAHALYGRRLRTAIWGCAIFSFVVAALWPLVREVFRMGVLGGAVYFLAYAAVAVIVGLVAQRKLLERVLVKFSLPQLVATVVFTLYTLILPTIWEMMTSDLQRALFRLIVHPIIFELAMLSVRIGARNMRHSHPDRAYLNVIYLQVLSALYGRFLVSATGDTRTTVLIAIVLAFEEIALRLSVGARDRLIYRLFKGRSMTASEVRARFQTTRALRLRGDLVCQDQVCEGVGIIGSSLAVLFFGLEVGGVALTTKRVVTDLALQVGIEYVTDLCVMDVELRMGVPLLGAWRARHGGKNARRNHFFYFAFFIATASFYFLHVFFAPLVGFLHRTHA